MEQKLQHILRQIEQAAKSAGRSPDSIQFVAVSKNQALEKIQAAFSLGVQNMGENRIQEALSKVGSAPDGIRWHFVGHLQRNKVKLLQDKFCLLHTLDSLKLAQEISQRADQGRPQNCLLQLNLAREPQKYGFDQEDLDHCLEKMDELSGIRIIGLMIMPPYHEDPEHSRPYFRQLRELRDRLSKRSFRQLKLEELSMGMSADFAVAIEEGATIVRIGTALFGPR